MLNLLYFERLFERVLERIMVYDTLEVMIVDGTGFGYDDKQREVHIKNTPNYPESLISP